MSENMLSADFGLAVASVVEKLEAENARLKELLNEFSNALEFAVKQESRLIYFEQIQSCIKKISREVQGE